MPVDFGEAIVVESIAGVGDPHGVPTGGGEQRQHALLEPPQGCLVVPRIERHTKHRPHSQALPQPARYPFGVPRARPQ